MKFHPTAANWFDAIIPYDQTLCALQTIANSASAQLEEQTPNAIPCIDKALIQRMLHRCEQLIAQYPNDLPEAAKHCRKVFGQPEVIAEQALAQLSDWADQVKTLRHRISNGQHQLEQLGLLSECLTLMRDSSAELEALNHPSDFLYKHLFACPHGQSCDTASCDQWYVEVYSGEAHDFVLIAADNDKQTLIESAAALYHCTSIEIPPWLPPERSNQSRELANRIDRITREIEQAFAQLKDRQQDPKIAQVRVHIRLLRWLLNGCIDQAPHRNTCRLGGWTLAPSAQWLTQLLRASGIQAEVVFSTPRSQKPPPVGLISGLWTRPFRMFVEMLGIPDQQEVDPSVAVSLIVPLLFGFMFPDVGHGLVLMVLGLLLVRRYPTALLLVPCGLSAVLFGWLFGEFFGWHHLINAPFGHIMEQPLEILLITLFIGIGIILLGLFFSGIEAYWRQQVGRWLLLEAPVILLYVSLLSLLIWPQLIVIPGLAIIWFTIGTLVLCHDQQAPCLSQHLGQLVESSFQLLLATLSFMRVGAFALAHAAFTGMGVQLLNQFDNLSTQILAFILIHALIIVAEGMIVMIQTTRLVVLEFFTRFLRFGGRIYTPLNHVSDDIPSKN